MGLDSYQIQRLIDAVTGESPSTAPVAYADGVLTVTSGAAVGPTIPAGDPPLRGVFVVEAASVRARWAGTAPDATTGVLLNPGDELHLDGAANIAAVLFIAMSADADVQYTLEQ